MCPCKLCRPDNFFAIGSGFSVGNIFIHRAGKQIHILLYHTDAAAQALQGKMADIFSVQEDFSLRGVIETGNQVAHGRLSAAGRADQGYFFTRFYRQVDMGKNGGVIVRIFKGNIVEGDFSLNFLNGCRSFFIKDIYVGIHQFHKAFHAGHSPLELFGKFDNPADSGKKGRYVKGVGNQIGGGNQTSNHKATSGNNNYHVHQAVEHADGVLKGRHIAVGVTLDGKKFLVVLVEFINLYLFIGKGADDLVS